MCADRSNVTLASRRFAKTARLTLFLFGALLTGTAGAAAGDKTDVVRDLAGRVGPIVGSASACRGLERPQFWFITHKFRAVVTETAPDEGGRPDLSAALGGRRGVRRSAEAAGTIRCSA